MFKIIDMIIFIFSDVPYDKYLRSKSSYKCTDYNVLKNRFLNPMIMINVYELYTRLNSNTIILRQHTYIPLGLHPALVYLIRKRYFYPSVSLSTLNLSFYKWVYIHLHNKIRSLLVLNYKIIFNQIFKTLGYHFNLLCPYKLFRNFMVILCDILNRKHCLDSVVFFFFLYSKIIILLNYILIMDFFLIVNLKFSGTIQIK